MRLIVARTLSTGGSHFHKDLHDKLNAFFCDGSAHALSKSGLKSPDYQWPESYRKSNQCPSLHISTHSCGCR